MTKNETICLNLIGASNYVYTDFDQNFFGIEQSEARAGIDSLISKGLCAIIHGSDYGQGLPSVYVLTDKGSKLFWESL